METIAFPAPLDILRNKSNKLATAPVDQKQTPVKVLDIDTCHPISELPFIAVLGLMNRQPHSFGLDQASTE
jgi:hypothetical protein